MPTDVPLTDQLVERLRPIPPGDDDVLPAGSRFAPGGIAPGRIARRGIIRCVGEFFSHRPDGLVVKPRDDNQLARNFGRR
jgi:hypothetical protein